MRRGIGWVGLVAVLLGAACAPARVADAGREGQACATAEAWFAALMQGDSVAAMALSAVPFSFDGTEVIPNADELRRRYEAVAAKKGRRDIVPDKVWVASADGDVAKDAAPAGCLPVKLAIGDEQVLVYVQPGKNGRVVGFRD